MPKAKRRKPYNPAKAHDRRSRDLLRNAEVATAEVDNPLALEPGEKIVALRSIRNDPLARLHSHRQIDEAQYQAGRAFQSDWEKAERGPRAVDPTREYVDGGQSREPITEGQRKAVLRLNRAERELGADGSALVHDVLVRGLTMEQVGQRRACAPNAGATISQGDSASVSTGWRCCMGLRRSILFPSKASSAERQRLHYDTCLAVRRMTVRRILFQPGAAEALEIMFAMGVVLPG
jgi:hypothetical protein